MINRYSQSFLGKARAGYLESWVRSFVNAAKAESGRGPDRYPESCLVSLNKGAAMIAKF